MVLLAELDQPNGTMLQVIRVDGAVYVSESIAKPDGEIVAGEGVVIDVSNLDAIIAALQTAKRDLFRPLDSAAE